MFFPLSNHGPSETQRCVAPRNRFTLYATHQSLIQTCGHPGSRSKFLFDERSGALSGNTLGAGIGLPSSFSKSEQPSTSLLRGHLCGIPFDLGGRRFLPHANLRLRGPCDEREFCVVLGFFSLIAAAAAGQRCSCGRSPQGRHCTQSGAGSTAFGDHANILIMRRQWRPPGGRGFWWRPDPLYGNKLVTHLRRGKPEGRAASYVGPRATREDDRKGTGVDSP